MNEIVIAAKHPDTITTSKEYQVRSLTPVEVGHATESSPVAAAARPQKRMSKLFRCLEIFRAYAANEEPSLE